MALLERVQADMAAAMKAKQEARLNALRMIKAALQKHQVDSMKPLDDAAEQQILKQLVKQRTDAAEMFRKGGRMEQAEKEEAERVLIQSYMPADFHLPLIDRKPRRRNRYRLAVTRPRLLRARTLSLSGGYQAFLEIDAD